VEFSFDKFYQLNRRIFIWGLLFLLIWLLRNFFGLIFLTFVLAFIAQPMSQLLQRRLRLPRRGAIVLVYLCFLATFVSVVTLITPRVVREASLMIGNLPQLEGKLLGIKNDLVADYPALEEAIPGYLASALSEGNAERGLSKNYREEYTRELAIIRQGLNLTRDALLTRDEPTTDAARLAALAVYDLRRDELLIRTFMAQQLDVLRDRLPHFIAVLYRASITVLLALLFSFLIMLDIAQLGKEVKSLRASRLRDFYNQTAQPVVRFAYVVGRAIQAQAVIAVINTVLTLAGLWILEIPSLVMLSFVVFFCSFVPVLGVFISTTPILLVALNSGGLGLSLSAMALVIGIHAVEAYLLNPLVYGQHFKINPVLVLMILFVGHHAFGLWGMILGVPVAYYFIHDVFGVPIWDEKKLPVGPKGDDAAEARPLAAMQRDDPGPAPRPAAKSDAARPDALAEPPTEE
jgi:predicted PurR-regulated permease PerM